MLHRQILFLLILSINLHESSAIDFGAIIRGAGKYIGKVITGTDDDWHCGSDKKLFSHFLAYSYANTCSDRLMEKINQVCLEHDNCYEDLLGQMNCDKKFCDGMMTARISVRGDSCHVPEKFCSLVQTHGKDAYGKGKPAGFYEEFEAEDDERHVRRAGITLLDFEEYEVDH